jgi:hypothetical protein
MPRKGSRKTMKGGSGAATNAINVFGGIGAQHAAGANDNTIAMKQQGGSGAATNAINVFGGIGQQHASGANDNTIAMKQQGGKKGGSFGVDLGAPLVLTGLNQYIKGRKSAKKGGKKGKKSKKVKRGGKRRRSAKKRGERSNLKEQNGGVGVGWAKTCYGVLTGTPYKPLKGFCNPGDTCRGYDC